MFVKRFHPLLCWVFFLAFAGQAIRNTVDWGGYTIVVLSTVSVLLTYLVRYKTPVTSVRLSPVLIYLMIAMGLSTIFSSYILWSFLGVAITLLTGLTAWMISRYYRWAEIKFSLWLSLMSALVLSFVLEIVVAFMGEPLLPFPLQGIEDPPGLFYWVQGLIFEGGPVQGIVGNRNLLGFIGLLALLLSVFNRDLETKWKIAGTVTAGVTILLTRSATITVALVSCLLVVGVVVLMRIWKTKYERTKYILLTFFTGAAITGMVLFYRPIVGVLNREPDMTSRFEIWGNVWSLFLEKPLTGWGWLGHWVPSVEPFTNLAVKNGVTHLHAHNAYLDVLFQIGVIGLLGFMVLLLVAGVRAWKIAVDHGTSKSMVPLILLIALLIQGVTESRLLLEGNLMLLLLIVFYVQKKTPVFVQLVGELKNDITGDAEPEVTSPIGDDEV